MAFRLPGCTHVAFFLDEELGEGRDEEEDSVFEDQPPRLKADASRRICLWDSNGAVCFAETEIKMSNDKYKIRKTGVMRTDAINQINFEFEKYEKEYV